VSTSAAAALAAVLPAERFAPPSERSSFTVDGLIPDVVVAPASAAEVATSVGAAGAAGLALLPAGLGAHLAVGMPPLRLDCVVSTARLAGVVEHAAADMTVTVQAGTTLASLNATLAAASQWLPLDPPLPSRTTVGGLLAANLSGPLRSSQGTARDLLIGLRAVRADGRVIASGGRVVKNVAGYDLHKAFVGSLGTLGIMVEATFKVRPRPPAESTVIVACASLDAAGRVVDALRSAPVEPLWMAMAGTDVAGTPLRAEAGSAGAVVALGIAGGPGSLGVQHDRIGAAVRGAVGSADLDIVAEPAATAGSGATAADAYLALRDFVARADGDAVCTVSVLPADLAGYLQEAGAASARDGVRWGFVAEPTVARLHLALGHTAGSPGDDRIAADDVIAGLVVRLRALAAARRGHLVIRRATPAVKARAGVWGDLGAAGSLMRRLRHVFDPQGLLARGRFIDST
jgi:glycolate oxidase FAD binding subunit